MVRSATWRLARRDLRAQRPELPVAVPFGPLATVAAATLAATFVASLVPAWWSARRIAPAAGFGPG